MIVPLLRTHSHCHGISSFALSATDLGVDKAHVKFVHAL